MAVIEPRIPTHFLDYLAYEMTSEKMYETRDSIEDIWGPRTPYKHEWPSRVDERSLEKADKWVQSACVLCSNGCGMDVGVKDGKIVGVRGRAVDRVNKGRLGPKGMHGWITNSHKDRLTHPLIRKNGKLEKASWDEAMKLVAEKAKDVKKRLTPHGIGFYTSGQLFLEEYYALAKIGKAGLNTLHMDGNTRLCTATAATAMRESFGSDGQPGSYTDIDFTDCLFIVGHNVSATQTVLWSRMLDRLDGPDPPKLIVVDPRLSNTAKRATVHLAPKIGTNMAVLNGIQHLLFKNGWVNEEWCEEHVVGLEALREKVKRYSPKHVGEITGIPAEKLEEAAQIIGNTKSLLSTALQGVYQSNQATASACQVNNINLLRGMIGKVGSGIFQMNGQPTAQNNRETGCDGEFPGFRNQFNQKQMEEIADVWNLDYHKVPHWADPTHIQNMLNFIQAGTIQMFWISGTNPLVSLPNLPRVRELLTKPDLFVVCQDLFMTETAQIADVVLPAAQWSEKTGCFTNVDRTVHIAYKAVDPPGEARSDFDIFVDFAKRMDFRDKDDKPLMPWTNPEQAFEEWKKMSKGRPCDYSEMTYALLTGGSGIQWPCNEDNPNGTERLFTDGVFYTDIEYCESYGHDLETGAAYTKAQYLAFNPAGRAFLKIADYIPDREATCDEYPFQLSTGRRVYHFHTRTKTGRAKALQDKAPNPWIQICKEDAAKLDVKDGEDVWVKSRRGEVQLPVHIAEIAQGQSFIPFHYGYFDSPDLRSRAANELTQEQWDPISKQPMFKSGAISIEKIKNVDLSEVKIHALERQSEAVKKVSKPKNSAEDTANSDPRVRHLEYWLGSTKESFDMLLMLFDKLAEHHSQDSEINTGMRMMQRIATTIQDRMEPMTKRYEEQHYGENMLAPIRNALFDYSLTGTSSYELLVALQGLFMCVCHLESHYVALIPASQAVWDGEFVGAVDFCHGQVGRMKAWVSQQIGVRSPQTLLVPVPLMGKWGKQEREN